MGIPRGSARLLLAEGRARPFGGTVLQLGRSSVYFTRRELERWARHDGSTLPAVDTALSHDPQLAAQGCLDDVGFFRLLGFDRVEAADIADWEGAEHIFDLNEPLPAGLAGRFDAVFDSGTTVQVFHLPQVLANIGALLGVGGRVLHCAVPSNNHMDMGFVMPCPTLFTDYYSANGWRIDNCLLCEYFPYWHRGRLFSEPWRVYRYTPGCLDRLSYGRYGGAQAAVFLVATKTAEATTGVVPQLGQYRRSWQSFAERGGSAGARAGEEPRGGAFAERLWAASPVLSRAYRVVKHVKERLARLLPRRMPPLVGRY